MKVDVIEMGDRPYLWTKARRYAPAGARVFGEVLGEADWADEALIVLDWENVWQSMPDALAVPILHIIVRKRLPDMPLPNVLDVSARLDVNDVFDGDEVTAEIILDVSRELQEKIAETITRRLS